MVWHAPHVSVNAGQFSLLSDNREVWDLLPQNSHCLVLEELVWGGLRGVLDLSLLFWRPWHLFCWWSDSRYKEPAPDTNSWWVYPIFNTSASFMTWLSKSSPPSTWAPAWSTRACISGSRESTDELIH